MTMSMLVPAPVLELHRLTRSVPVEDAVQDPVVREVVVDILRILLRVFQSILLVLFFLVNNRYF